MSIFISYSRKDQDYVNKLVEALRKQELSWWLDSKIDYGDQWTSNSKFKWYKQKQNGIGI